MQTMLRHSFSSVPVSSAQRHGGRARLSHIVRVAQKTEETETSRKEPTEAKPIETIASQEPKAPKEAVVSQAPKEAVVSQEPKAPKEAVVSQAPKAPKETVASPEPKAPKETKEAVESRERKAGPLARGGTLAGELAAGKDASPAFKAAVVGTASTGTQMQIIDGCFRDDRWKDGRWVLSKFAGADGKMDWDAVIDVEIARRKLLETSPIPSTNEEPVLFDTSEIPWWAWVRRFHLPVAEKLNGRAAMMGYFLALVVDQLTGAGLLDQQNSFFGKVALHVVVFAVLLVRNTKDLDQYKNLLDEATFYDRQWQATWDGIVRPSEKEKS